MPKRNYVKLLNNKKKMSFTVIYHTKTPRVVLKYIKYFPFKNVTLSHAPSHFIKYFRENDN